MARAAATIFFLKEHSSDALRQLDPLLQYDRPYSR